MIGGFFKNVGLEKLKGDSLGDDFHSARQHFSVKIAIKHFQILFIMLVNIFFVMSNKE